MWFRLSGVGLLVLTMGVIVSILGVAWADSATELTGFIIIVVGGLTTIYDAKSRKSWPWNMRNSEAVAVLVCVSGVTIGACVIYFGLWSQQSWIPSLTAFGLVDIAVGALGLVLVWRLAMTRNSETATKLTALCVAVILVVILGIIYYLTHLEFGTT